MDTKTLNHKHQDRKNTHPRSTQVLQLISIGERSVCDVVSNDKPLGKLVQRYLAVIKQPVTKEEVGRRNGVFGVSKQSDKVFVEMEDGWTDLVTTMYLPNP